MIFTIAIPFQKFHCFQNRYLADNNFTSLPSKLPSQLARFEAENCQLSGALPPLPSTLTRLYLDRNQFTVMFFCQKRFPFY